MSHPTLPPELDPRGPRRAGARRSRQVPAEAGTAEPSGAGAGRSTSPGRSRCSCWPSAWWGPGWRATTRARPTGSTPGSPAAATAVRRTGCSSGRTTAQGSPPQQIAHLHVGGATTANASGRRSDTMILLHLSAGSDKATLISLPRDSYVLIPAYKDSKGRQHPAAHNKLNAAYDLGGPALTVQTVQIATGLHIDHYVEIGFGGFVKMVDTIGGVDVCTTKALHDPESGLNLKAGTSKLDGQQALEYVRARYVDPTADLGRMKRQQAFLGSLFRTALSTQVLLNPLKLNAFLGATLSSITLDTHLTRDDLLGLATRTKGLSPSNVVFATVPLSDVELPAVPPPSARPCCGTGPRPAPCSPRSRPTSRSAARPPSPASAVGDRGPGRAGQDHRAGDQRWRGHGCRRACRQRPDQARVRHGRTGHERGPARRHPDPDHLRPSLRREPQDPARPPTPTPPSRPSRGRARSSQSWWAPTTRRRRRSPPASATTATPHPAASRPTSAAQTVCKTS